MAATPTIVRGVRANRRFLGRAVRYMTQAGVRQFLDIGTGIPTASNTHEVAQSIAPLCRVVYVDNDPIVLSHARALLTSTPGPTAYIDADARDPAALTHPARDQVAVAVKAETSLTKSMGQQVTFRTRDQVSQFGAD